MANDAGWSADDIPDLSGRIAVVTGANSGIGYETARALARRGARVVLGCRDSQRAESAVRSIIADLPDARVRSMPLDLASLASVRAFAEAFIAEYPQLDLLCNNAGVMAIPYRKTSDGFEMQIGTNHLGHFGLTGMLLERLLATPGSRVVNVSSTAHRFGEMRFEDLHFEKASRYPKWRAYGQSKLANLLFTYELQRRLEVVGSETSSLGCHPGYAATNLQAVGPRMQGSSLRERMTRVANRVFAQDAATGALPTLYAGTCEDARGGEYFGPGRFAESWGPPVKVRSSARSHDQVAAGLLWEISEEATGVPFAALSR